MIQDIAPHYYNNHYAEYAAEEEDFCICVKEDRALLSWEGNEWHIPSFRELGKDTEKAVYLFSIDEKRYFLPQPPEDKERGFQEDESKIAAGPADDMQAEGFSWKNRRDMREILPRYIAFAGITALQLYGWYCSNRFCGRCGARLEPDHRERMLRCPSCGNMVYPRINPAVIIAVTDGSRLLMTKYAGRTYTRYALVAGFTEIGETLEQTVAREVMEETGLRVKNIRYYKSQPWSFSDTLLTGFFCQLDGDSSIHIDREELSTAEWIERGEINQAQESYDDLSLTNEMIVYFRDHEEVFL